MPTLEHHKLLSQGEILKHQRTAGTEQAENRRETEPNDGKHSSDIPELDAMRSLRKSLILKPSSILARHRAMEKTVASPPWKTLRLSHFPTATTATFAQSMLPLAIRIS
jgi:hypothetical protein